MNIRNVLFNSGNKQLRLKAFRYTFFLITLLFSASCSSPPIKPTVNKTTTLTYLGDETFRLTTKLIIPKDFGYQASSDCIFWGNSIYNIVVLKNSQQLAQNEYLIRKDSYDLDLPLLGKKRYVIQYLSVDHSDNYATDTDTIYFSFDYHSKHPPDSSKNLDFMRLWVGEIKLGLAPTALVKSNLIIKSEDKNYTIPTLRTRVSEDEEMKIKNFTEYSYECSWETKSIGFDIGMLNPYQLITFQRSSRKYSLVGDVYRTLDLSRVDIGKETFDISLKGRGSLKYLQWVMPFPKELGNPEVKLSVEIDGTTHTFFPDSNYFDKNFSDKLYHYYLGSRLDSSLTIYTAFNSDQSYAYYGNILLCCFPSDSISISHLRIESEFSTNDFIKKQNYFDYDVKYPYGILYTENARDVFRIILPTDFYFSSIDLLKYVNFKSDNEVIYKGIYGTNNFFLNFSFKNKLTKFFDFLYWSNRILLITTLLFTILFVFKLSEKFVSTADKIIKFILTLFASQFLFSFFNPVEFWPSFFYTESYLFIITAILWLAHQTIIDNIRKLIKI